MKKKMILEEIREFWRQQAFKHGKTPDASWSDYPVIHMEIRQLLKLLEDGDRVLDVGCGNGYSTIQLAAQKSITIRGLDYVPEMIEQARLHLSTVEERLLGNVEFDIGEITNLNEPDDTYDKVTVVRVIINLMDWKHQLQGLKECIRVLKPRGTLLLSEATLQGWRKMNDFRAEWGLPEIHMPSFNEYLDENQVIEAVAPDLELVKLVNFSSTYFVATRVLKPLLVQVLDADVDVASPDMEWNRFFSMLPPCGDYGTQKLFVFKKK